MGRRAYVTGASGFLGRRLVFLLQQEGWQVRALVLPSDRGGSALPEEADIVQGDVKDPESLRGTMDGCDACFHLAALVAPWIPDGREFFRVNLLGTENVIEEALRARVGRFLFTSSLSGIGMRPGEVLREDSPPGKAFGAYEESKAEAERAVFRAYRERGLPAVVVVPGIVLGRGDTRNAGKFLLDFVRREFPGTFAEDSVIPVVGVEDAARGLLRAHEYGRVGERYIIAAENVRWGDLIRMASDASGIPVPSRHIGARAVWLASRAGEVWARVTRAPPRLPAWVADFLQSGAPMDNSKSIRELGMTYTPIRDSIRDAIEWFWAEGLANPPPTGAYGNGRPAESEPLRTGDEGPPFLRPPGERRPSRGEKRP